jgi:soluble lytic murein transglycosylase-like protein
MEEVDTKSVRTRDMHVKNPFDPEENIEGGTKYFRSLLNLLFL